MEERKLNTRKCRLRNKKYKNQKYSTETKNNQPGLKESKTNEAQNQYESDNNLSLQQPTSSYAELELQESSDDDSGSDFMVLSSIPIEQSSKTDNRLGTDTLQNYEFLSLDLNDLSSAISCIPFNEYTHIDAKYFTIDQLISMQNLADAQLQNYMLRAKEKSEKSKWLKDKMNKNVESDNKDKDLEKKMSSELVNAMNEDINDTHDLETDLNSLLLLTEPVKTVPVMNISPPSPADNNDKRVETSMPIKSIDLEKWLDSVLDD
ncbi:uncharacterized protein [Prorops nasuta]|uniref:uncharacterized protein n=1 Tax=Prorops nasuta TaxID=863751 RepID=UPI0034CF9155